MSYVDTIEKIMHNSGEDFFQQEGQKILKSNNLNLY
jgi:hypothetical protein